MRVEWRDVVGYEGIYQVSSYGEVRSVDRIDRANRFRPAQLIKPGADRNGYLTVGLRGREKKLVRKIHQLVLEAFVGPRPTPEHLGLHSDDDKVNNYAGNLRWGTSAENGRDKTTNGRSTKGESNPGRKLDEAQVIEIRQLIPSLSTDEISKRFGISRSSVHNIRNGHTWAHIAT